MTPKETAADIVSEAAVYALNRPGPSCGAVDTDVLRDLIAKALESRTFDREEAALLMEWIDEIEMVTSDRAIAARIRAKLEAIAGPGIENLWALRHAERQATYSVCPKSATGLHEWERLPLRPQAHTRLTSDDLADAMNVLPASDMKCTLCGKLYSEHVIAAPAQR